ncbi:ABC transporter ATP-binding protein [Lactobacillus sp. ESL0791]|uniref:ATP-binding cassette domain-containing protein n=1 Tax=Lactobacillus sp. ESL0791 TaxID=2983234 RepID=UPI0023F78DBE|nr:ABC transporter ATP-binding protein [Lactobacillus sp. ESL0791]MDF7638348.1 ABC transporter ATP-binding protein [Lactobacillus sp. ESL0791]
MQLKGLIKINYLRASTILLLEIANALAITYGSYIIITAYNQLSGNNLFLFVLIVVASLVMQFGGYLLSALANYLFSKQIQDYIHQIRSQMIKHYYQNKPLAVANMQNELNNNLQILTDSYANQLLNILNSILLVITSIGTLFILNWRLVLLTVVLALVTLYIPRFAQKQTAAATEEIAKKNTAYLANIQNWFNGLAELRRYLAFSVLDTVMQKQGWGLEKTYVRRQKIWSIVEFINGCANSFSQIAITVEAALLFFQGSISFGAIFAVGNFSSSIFAGILTITTSLTRMQSAKPINGRILHLRVCLDNKTCPHAQFSAIKTRNLSIAYSSGQKISYPDLTITKGEKILLTGDSGVGKSTLFKLLLGEIKPATGQIVFQDDVGKTQNRAAFQIGYIPQDGTLFPASIQENITMFDQNLDSQVDDTLKEVELAQNLQQTAKGKTVKINLDNPNISGGQKQKIILARNEIRQKQILLADEPTSAIDKVTSKQILTKLLAGKQTIIVIAHNLDQATKNLFDREIHLCKRDDSNEL